MDLRDACGATLHTRILRNMNMKCLCLLTTFCGLFDVPWLKLQAQVFSCIVRKQLSLYRQYAQYCSPQSPSTAAPRTGKRGGRGNVQTDDGAHDGTGKNSSVEPTGKEGGEKVATMAEETGRGSRAVILFPLQRVRELRLPHL